MKVSIEELKRKWWIFAEIVISVFIVGIVPLFVSDYIKPDFDMIELSKVLGGDAMTLMGFVIQALAIIGALVDRDMLNRVRAHPSFSDLWLAFVISAICLGCQAVIGRISFILIFPEIIILISQVLAIFNALLIGSCIVLLAKFISLVNEGKKAEIAKKTLKKSDLKVNE